MDIFEKRRQQLKISSTVSNNNSTEDIFAKRRNELATQGQSTINMLQAQKTAALKEKNIVPKEPVVPNTIKLLQAQKSADLNAKNSIGVPTPSYVKTFKEVPKNIKSGNLLGATGNALKGTGQTILQGFQNIGTLPLRASKTAINTVKGKGVGFDANPNFTVDNYLKDTGNAQTDKLYNTTGGKIASSILGVVSDPLTWVGGGIASDMAKARKIGTVGLLNDAKIGQKISSKIKPNVGPLNDVLSQPNKSNVITPSLSKELPKVGNKNAAVNIDNGSSMLNVKVPKNKGNLTETVPITKNTILPEPMSKITASGRKEPTNIGDKFNKFYTRTVDTNRPFTKVDRPTYELATNSKSTGGIVDHVLTGGLVNKNGVKVGESLKKTVETIPKGKESDFWTYMSQRHNIDRAREGKPVQANYTPDMSTEAVRRIEQSSPEFKKVGDNITGWIDTFMRTWGVDTGIVDKDIYNSLRQTYKSYFPTQRDFSELEKSITNGGSKKYVDLSGPLKKAKGSERDIINPVENIMNLVNRTVRTAKYNEVGQGLLSSVRKDPNRLSNLAEIVPTQEGMFANTDNVVSVLENGKPTYLRINNKPLLDALNNINKTSIGDIEKVAKKATGIFKALITQKNPVFAVRNIARDVPTAYVNGSEHNPLKFGKNLLSAGKDLITDSKAAQQYRGVGGGGANFFNSGNVAKSANELVGNINPVKKVFKGIGNGIEKFNNLTESAPRLAEFKTVLKKTGDTRKALYAANDITTNFSRGGDITKTVDSVVPYINAGVQGLDKLVRQVATHPIGTLIKGALAVTAPTLILDHINKNNPNYQQLDQRTKDNYFLFPNPTDGGKTFIKLPKARELGVLFSTLEQRIARAYVGDKEAFKGMGETVATNFAPSNPLQNNIISPIYNLASNKNWAGSAIVPQGMIMDNRSKYLQSDEKTSDVTKKITQVLHDKFNMDLSPKQMDYIIKSYTGVIGQMGLPAATNNGGTTLQRAVKPITSQFTADPVYSNQTLTNFYSNFDKLKQKAADKNILEKIPSKLVTPEEKIRNQFNKASLQISDLNKQIKALDQVTDNQKIRDLRQQINDIANNTNSMLK